MTPQLGKITPQLGKMTPQLGKMTLQLGKITLQLGKIIPRHEKITVYLNISLPTVVQSNIKPYRRRFSLFSHNSRQNYSS
jgi:hypothetical protein